VVCDPVTGHSAIVSMLLDGKADYASSDANGATSLHYAALNDFAVSSKL
jgi:ankyrin repeat protein